ncbi:MAG: sigma-54 interaction domain-containing protein [Treponema sp.]|jgi:PAS modulated sigma54 specific transcriptional regulator, fis family|uniref:sigma-54 interaction domain-containing protein n=1 Tax=Treponema sp. TaxID=166 RepID=UPI0028E18F4F|nr:sigma 54-interacting transcriptional regulator [uncultured Treponema sp.]
MMEMEFYKIIFEEVLRLSDDGFIVVDKHAIVTDINDRYSAFLGKPKEEIIGRPITDVIPNSKMADIMRNEYREELAMHKYIPGYVRDATNDFVLVSRTYVKDSAGDTIGGVAQVHFREQAIQSARRMLKEYNELEFLREQYKQFNGFQLGFKDIIGKSAAIQSKKREAMRASKTNFSVLITGESGTGKEVFAKAIHYASRRCRRPFVSVNCAAIPGELLEAELFGYEEGSFTGAKKGGRKGKFIQADGGTIFLDEIGDMPLVMQAKILRVLQEREVDMVGGTKPIPVDIRVISATRKNLENMIREGTFREDLYYRLNVINIHLPPLRERTEDIPCLVQYYMDKLNREYKRNVGISKKVIEAFYRHSWNGNVRELDNVIKGAYAVCDDLEILPSDLPTKFEFKDENEPEKKIPQTAPPPERTGKPREGTLEAVRIAGSMKEFLKSQEKEMILAAYEKFHTVRKASAYLGMSMPTYVRKRREYLSEEEMTV